MDRQDRLAYIPIIIVLVFIAGYFVHLNTPYWAFILSHNKTAGTIVDVDTLNSSNYELAYQFVSIETSILRTRSVRTSNVLSIGDTVAVLYNPKYPNYVEVAEIGSPYSLFRTVLSVILPVFCLMIIILGLYGKIDLDKYS